MSIRVGKPAPELTVETYVRGESEPRAISLAGLRGKWVVLFFYPRDFTFVCPTELRAFARLQRDFARERAVVLGASTDSYYVHQAWYESDERLREVAYPVIADPGHQLCAAYGVLREDGAALRSTFILDPEGILRHALVNDLEVGRNVEETLRTLRALKTGELCPVGWQPGQATLSNRADEVAQAAD